MQLNHICIYILQDMLESLKDWLLDIPDNWNYEMEEDAYIPADLRTGMYSFA